MPSIDNTSCSLNCTGCGLDVGVGATVANTGVVFGDVLDDDIVGNGEYVITGVIVTIVVLVGGFVVGVVACGKWLFAQPVMQTRVTNQTYT